MARSTNKVVPEAKAALDKFKYEVASDMCVKNIFTYLLATSFFTDEQCSPLHFLCRLF